jgi:hypothetical protein
MSAFPRLWQFSGLRLLSHPPSVRSATQVVWWLHKKNNAGRRELFMNIDDKENAKPKLVLASSVWMVIVGLSLILFDGIILSITDPTRNFQKSLLSGVLGIISIALGLLYWKEKRWSIFISAGLTLGAVLFSNGLHSIIYILSAVITSTMMSVHFKFNQISEKSNIPN